MSSALALVDDLDPDLLALPLDVLLRDKLKDATSKELDDVLWWRCLHDRETFCLAYFPDRFTSAFNALHLDLLAEAKVPWRQRLAMRLDAWKAPRGAAKSTLVSFVDVVHSIVYGFEAFVGIISTNFDLSLMLVKDLYDVFTDPDGNAELHRMYGPFTVRGTKTDFVVYSPSAGDPIGTRVKGYSMQGACRGHKHKGIRFTQWILDDAERSDRVTVPEQRDKNEQFLDADVVRAGDVYTRVVFVGTVLHTDSVLARKSNPARDASKGWDAHHYQAIIEWPEERDGMWEEVRAIWADIRIGTSKERKAAAHAFYLANREALDRGARVLWPEKEGLFELMTQWWSNPFAFATEKQNTPEASGEITFDVDAFEYVRFDGQEIVVPGDEASKPRAIDLRTCNLAVWWDPIPYGARGTGKDSAAFAVVAKDRNGVRFVLEIVMVKGSPQRQWDILWTLMRRYPTAAFGYENNKGGLGDNEDFQRQLAAVRHEFPNIRIRGHQSTGVKEVRIANIQPATANGLMRFAHGIPGEAVDQFRHFPHGRNDDAPDAVERADWLLQSSQIPTVSARPM